MQLSLNLETPMAPSYELDDCHVVSISRPTPQNCAFSTLSFEAYRSEEILMWKKIKQAYVCWYWEVNRNSLPECLGAGGKCTDARNVRVPVEMIKNHLLAIICWDTSDSQEVYWVQFYWSIIIQLRHGRWLFDINILGPQRTTTSSAFSERYELVLHSNRCTLLSDLGPAVP